MHKERLSLFVGHRRSAVTFSHSMIPVVIVESHQHVLEHIHDVLRRKQKQKQLDHWSMLHFDAHPDLGLPPNLPALSCFRPRQPELWCGNKNLYELLDSTASGIAEWMLPLVMAANLKTIDWVKPPCSNQLPVGHHSYRVGAYDPKKSNHCHRDDISTSVQSFMDLEPDHVLRVDWCHTYYLDDEECAVVSTDQLVLPQTLHLNVMELQAAGSRDHLLVRKDMNILDSNNLLKNDNDHSLLPWSLDICLDYFACVNPFIAQLEQLDPTLVPLLEQLIVQAEAKISIQSALCSNSDRGGDGCSSPHSNVANSEQEARGEQYRSKRAKFHSLLQELLRSLLLVKDVKRDTTIAKALLAHYSDGGVDDDSSRILEEEAEQVEVMTGLIQSILSRRGSVDERVIDMAIEALPLWTSMPHATEAFLTENHPNPKGAALDESSLNQVQCYLEKTRHERRLPPFMITIARSTDDGFTPDHLVEELQSRVLEMLQQIFGNGDDDDDVDNNSSFLQIVRDYGEWEGSTIEW